jgi:hypothetical protein
VRLKSTLKYQAQRGKLYETECAKKKLFPEISRICSVYSSLFYYSIQYSTVLQYTTVHSTLQSLVDLTQSVRSDVNLLP